MAKIIYLMLVVLGVGILARRGFALNVWWVAFISTAIYVLPVLFGVDSFGKELRVEAQAVLLFPLALSLLCAAVFLRSRTEHLVRVTNPAGRSTLTLIVLIGLEWGVLGMLVLTYGLDVFFLHKIEAGVAGEMNIAWRLSAGIAVIACLILKRTKFLLLAVVPLIATIFAGDRTALGMTLIAFAWLKLEGSSLTWSQVLRVAVPILLVGVFLFFGKTFQAQWAGGTFESLSVLVEAVVKDGEDSITSSEPFVIAGVLNALVTLDISPPGSPVIEVFAQVLIVPSMFGFSSSSFNDFFQPILFPGFRESSLAYSFWGEGFVRGGWLGVVLFGVIYLLGLRFFDALIRSRRLLVVSAGYCGGAYWAFYIHRNSLVSILAYERHIAIYTFFVAAVVILLWMLRLRRRVR